jgi:hypothetical protein
LRVYGWVQGLGFRVSGLRCGVELSAARVQGSGYRVQGLGFRVQDLGFQGFRV